MLSSISISNFRTFRSETIPLKPITVFIGPNNSGKTNAFRAIQRRELKRSFATQVRQRADQNT